MRGFAGATMGIAVPSSSSSSGRAVYIHDCKTNFPYRYSQSDDYKDYKYPVTSMPENAIQTETFGFEHIPSLFMRQKFSEIEEYISKVFCTLSEEKKVKAFIELDKLHITNISQKQSEWWVKIIVKYGERLEPCLQVYRILLMRTREQKYAENMLAYLTKEMPFVSIDEFIQTVKCIERYGEITQKCAEYRQKLIELQKLFTKAN